jgi:hypothetical protein
LLAKAKKAEDKKDVDKKAGDAAHKPGENGGPEKKPDAEKKPEEKLKPPQADVAEGGAR